MTNQENQRITVFCNKEDFTQWSNALSIYELQHADPNYPLLQLLQKSQERKDQLFIIVESACESDAVCVEAIKKIREADTSFASSLRIAYVANDSRTIPSYFFRVLANLDVYDFASSRVPIDGVENVYMQIADVIFRPRSYAEAALYFSDSIVNPYLLQMSDAQQLYEKSRVQNRIAVAQIDQRRGGSTHTSFVLARSLVLFGYKVAVFLTPRTWHSLRRAYPRARCSTQNGLVTLAGIDFYRNEGFAQINGYDYVIADFNCASWIDLNATKESLELQRSFDSAQLGILTSVVSPFGDHSSFERVLKIWQKQKNLQKLGGVKFSFFGMPNDDVLENWSAVAQSLNSKAELYSMPYIPDPLHLETVSNQVREVLMSLLAPVLHKKGL